MKDTEDKAEIVHVQSVMLQTDVTALKEKTHATSIKEAISKAVKHYLKCEHTEEKKSGVMVRKD